MTAVEWLENCLTEQYPNGSFVWNTRADLEALFDQAKEMEKQQIIDADLNGSVRTANALDFKISPSRTKELAEQYYNETFKNK